MINNAFDWAQEHNSHLTPPDELETEPEIEPEYIAFHDGGKHQVGDMDCDQGWCGQGRYPAKCQCGGLIHAEFGDENLDGDYWTFEACDRCGENYREAL